MKSFVGRYIGRPWMPWSAYPWRQMDNRERRARWEVAYRSQVPVEPIPWPLGRMGQRNRESGNE